MTNDFYSRLALRVKELNFSQREIARRLGLSSPTVNAWFSGKAKNVRYENAIKLAAILECSPDWLLYGENSPALKDNSRKEILFGHFQLILNSPEFVEEGHLGIGLTSSRDGLRAVRMKGLSMEPEISDGDILAIDSNQKQIENGKVYGFFIGERFTIAKLSLSLQGKLQATTINPYETAQLDPMPVIIGKVLVKLSALK